MRRAITAAAILFLVACRREAPVETKRDTPQPSSTTAAPDGEPRTAVPRQDMSTPQHCAADGSYRQAVDCFRQIAHLKFTFGEGEGEMKRPTPGAEQLVLHIRKGANAGDWTAATKATGVVWQRNGTRSTAVPAELERMFQRLTIYLDPQKKEGEPKLAGVEQFETATANHYEFTDANNGDHYDVWVAKADGAIARLKVNEQTITFGR